MCDDLIVVDWGLELLCHTTLESPMFFRSGHYAFSPPCAMSRSDSFLLSLVRLCFLRNHFSFPYLIQCTLFCCESRGQKNDGEPRCMATNYTDASHNIASS